MQLHQAANGMRTSSQRLATVATPMRELLETLLATAERRKGGTKA